MLRITASISIIAALLFASAATASESPTDSKLLGEFLAGSYANYVEDASARADYYTRAYDRLPENVTLGRRALTSAITAGDYRHAFALAKTISRQKADEPLSRAILGAKAFKEGRYKKAAKYLDEPTDDLTIAILMKLIGGWNAYASNDEKAADEAFDSVGGGQYFQIIGNLQQAKIAALKGDKETADTLFVQMEEDGYSVVETAMSRARYRVASGQKDEALEELRALSAKSNTFRSGPIRSAIDTLATGGTIKTKLSVQENASRMLTDPALAFFAQRRAADVAEVFLRIALFLDNENDKASIWLGSLLEDNEREDAAAQLYDNIDDNSPYVVTARLAKANIYFDREDDEKGIAILEEVNAKHPSIITRDALGRARLFRENYADALPIYNAIVEAMSEDELKENIQPLYFRAICYEREKQWEKAVVDFQKVLELDSENSDALNYLGYTWVDRGENLTEAFEMIRKAVELQPQSGAIVDSLGWAHYKLGQYSQARIKLENAVVLSPSSATIVDHLGDVYWRLGRFREAGYQWERALEFDPTEEEVAQIKLKLTGDFDAAQRLKDSAK